MAEWLVKELDKLYVQIDDCKRCGLGKLPMNSARRLRFKPGKKPVLAVSQNPGCRVVKGCDYVWGGLDILFDDFKNARPIADAVWITNLVKCRTPDNAKPCPDQVNTCSAWLKQEIEIIRPLGIIGIGKPATNWLRSNIVDIPINAHAHPRYVFQFKRSQVGNYLEELNADVVSFVGRRCG